MRRNLLSRTRTAAARRRADGSYLPPGVRTIYDRGSKRVKKIGGGVSQKIQVCRTRTDRGDHPAILMIHVVRKQSYATTLRRSSAHTPDRSLAPFRPAPRSRV